MKKVYIETMGCQMNKSDAERMYGMLEHLGYTETTEPKDADMLILDAELNLRAVFAMGELVEGTNKL